MNQRRYLGLTVDEITAVLLALSLWAIVVGMILP